MIYFIGYMMVGLAYGVFSVLVSKDEIMEILQSIGIVKESLLTLIVGVSMVGIALTWPFWCIMIIYMYNH